MKRSINAWSVPGEVPFRAMFHDLAAAGYEGVELNIDGENGGAHSLKMDVSAEKLRGIKSLSDEYGLPVHSISTSLYGDSLGSKDAARREFGKKLLMKQVECAEALGADAILAVPGGIGPENSIRSARDNSAESLLSIKSQISGTKVKIGLENVWNYFFAGPIDMAEFIDQLDIPNVGAYFDVGNVAIFSEPEHWIEILGERIVKIHVKDFARAGWNAGTFVNLLEGSINWKKVTPALRVAGYDGYITAELGAMPNTPNYLYEITNSALKLIIAM